MNDNLYLHEVYPYREQDPNKRSRLDCLRPKKINASEILFQLSRVLASQSLQCTEHPKPNAGRGCWLPRADLERARREALQHTADVCRIHPVQLPDETENPKILLRSGRE